MAATDRFCPACGGRLAEQPVHGAPRLVCGGCGRVHYRNSKPAVGGVIVRDGRALLCRRAREPFRGAWDLPGGFLEAGEHPEEGLARELAEETGLVLRRCTLLGVWMGTYGEGGDATLNLLYAAEAEGEPLARDDVAEVRWWPLDALPEVPWPHEREALRRVRENRAGVGGAPAAAPERA